MNDNELLNRLHHRFTADAAAAGLLDIAYRVIDSPLGRLLLAATEAGVVRVAFALEDHDAVLADLADRVSPRVLEAPARLDTATRALTDYLDGRSRQVDVPVDLRLLRGYRREVAVRP